MEITLTNAYTGRLGEVFPTDNTTWQDLGSSPYATWANWTAWNPDPKTITVQLDVDTINNNPKIPLLRVVYQGEITVTLKITDSFTTDSQGIETGLFAGEETTITVTDTAQDWVNGRFFRWIVTLSTDSALVPPMLFVIKEEFSDVNITEFQANINTATLSGTIDARQITTAVSVVDTLIVTATEQGNTYSSGLLQDRTYVRPDDYVFQENSIIVNTVSKSPPTIRCFDLNGESIDATVDVYIRGYPKILLTENGVVTA